MIVNQNIWFPSGQTVAQPTLQHLALGFPALRRVPMEVGSDGWFQNHRFDHQDPIIM